MPVDPPPKVHDEIWLKSKEPSGKEKPLLFAVVMLVVLKRLVLRLATAVLSDESVICKTMNGATFVDANCAVTWKTVAPVPLIFNPVADQP